MSVYSWHLALGLSLLRSLFTRVIQVVLFPVAVLGFVYGLMGGTIRARAS